VFYMLVSGVLTGIVPYTELNTASPVATALLKIGKDWAAGMISLGAIAGLTTVMLVLYYAITRILFAVSRDGLLPPFFSHISARTRPDPRHRPDRSNHVRARRLPAAQPARRLTNIGTSAPSSWCVPVCW
jgi:hypothetical protein